MRRTWLLIDVSSVAYRCGHAMAGQGDDGFGIAAAYGLFRTVLDLHDLHQPAGVAFCFDRGHSKRSEICPAYKQTRLPKEDKGDWYALTQIKHQMRKTFHWLRTDHLPAIGCRNVLSTLDYEADDVIASVCEDIPRGDTAIIVSTDSDLFQLLRDDWVLIWNMAKKRLVTAAQFRDEYGIDPKLWAEVKAIAGCPSDNVAGVRGVGARTAVKFLTGRLSASTKAFRSITTSHALWEKNLRLTRLPFPGVGSFQLRADDFDERLWRVEMNKLGAKLSKGSKV